MKLYVLDANALVRYLRRTPGAVTVRELIERAKKREVRLSISPVNLAEAFYVLSKYFRPDEVRQMLQIARTAIESEPIDSIVALEAGSLKLRHRLGLADSFAAELAIRLGATLVTADPEFERVGKPLKLLSLPHHGA